MQAVTREYPAPQLDPASMHDAPYYCGSGKLQNKAALITGGVFVTNGGHAFTFCLAMQLVPRGIRVNAVAPGAAWTSHWSSYLTDEILPIGGMFSGG